MARVVTVDIDATAVRLLQARGNRVERWASLPLEPGMVESGGIADPAALAQQVKRLASSSGIKGRPVVASLSGVYSVSRVLRLPPQPSSRIEKSLPQLLQEAMPAPDLTPAGQVVASDGLNPQVLVVGTPANLVNAQVRALRLAGLSPKVLELKGMALTRAVNRSWAIIVNIEPSCLDIIVVADRVPYIMRTVSLPGELATEGLGEQVVHAAQSTVAFYESQNPERPLKSDTPLFLLGPLAEKVGLRDFVSSRLAYPPGVFAPALRFPSHLPLAEYAVNLGLAQRLLAHPRKDLKAEEQALPLRINLSPRAAALRLSRRSLRLLGAIAAGIVLIFLIPQLTSGAGVKTAQLEGQLDILEQQVGRRAGELRELTQLEAAIKGYNTIVASQGQLTDLVSLLEQSVTPGITLTSIQATDTSVMMAGKAETLEQAIAYVRALQNLKDAKGAPLFKEVPFTQPQTSFLIKADLTPPKPK